MSKLSRKGKKSKSYTEPEVVVIPETPETLTDNESCHFSVKENLRFLSENKSCRFSTDNVNYRFPTDKESCRFPIPTDKDKDCQRFPTKNGKERCRFSKTMQQMAIMKDMLRCVHCKEFLKGLYSIGKCEHKYCEKCLAKVMQNTMCFICDAQAIPADVKFDGNFNQICFKFSKIAASIEAEIANI